MSAYLPSGYLRLNLNPVGSVQVCLMTTSRTTVLREKVCNLTCQARQVLRQDGWDEMFKCVDGRIASYKFTSCLNCLVTVHIATCVHCQLGV